MTEHTKSEIRTRFAPSPTGLLHVGGARTALFNWLYAKKHGGKFLLRIEDTDKNRSSETNTRIILENLRWAGLNWDEEILYQSSRIKIYQKSAFSLLEEGKAYRCFCSYKLLDAKRKRAEKSGSAFLYEQTCRHLSETNIKTNLEKNTPFTLRLKLSEGVTGWIDEIRGEIKINHSELDDFIILRSDGTPIYQLAVVVDDHEMRISNVIRGEDHISNTPKQILLFKAFQWTIPSFAHLPLILGPDGKRLSKRHGSTSIVEFRERGFLPEALINYLSLLGWSPGNDRELMDMDEILGSFSIKNVSKKSSLFDEAKLQWINAHYIRSCEVEKIYPDVKSYLISKNIITEQNIENEKDYILSVIHLMKDRVKTLTDFVEEGIYFFCDPTEFDQKGIKKFLKLSDIWNVIAEYATQLMDQSRYDQESIEKQLREFADEKGISAAKIIHPLRLALTGKTASPGIFELMYLLGKEAVLRRINLFLNRREYLIQILEEH
jgi:glutamyl-tRNA synthetase